MADSNIYGNAWVSNNARVYYYARVSSNAWVSGNARVYDNARVSSNAWVFGNALVFGDARVYGKARVFGDARVYGKARVFGDAEVCGDAWVSGDARVFGNAVVSGGTIDGEARIGSAADLVQIVADGVVWSRFPQVDGTYRTTNSAGVMTMPTWVSAALDDWQEARRG